MMKGMYIAASGMSYQVEQLNEAAANLANVNTSGYKRSQLIGESFESLVHQFTQPTGDNRAGVGVRPVGRARIDNQGSMVRTNNPLNVAISGDGYFQIQDANGTVQVSRNGDFRMDNQGFLATASGERVLGVDNAPIQVGGTATTDMRIREDGMIMAGANPIGQIKVVAAAEAEAETFPVSNAAAQAVANGYTLQQGYLESSNVSVISEMVNMVTINKAFNFNQKAITTQDNLLNKTVNDLGRVQ